MMDGEFKVEGENLISRKKGESGKNERLRRFRLQGTRIECTVFIQIQLNETRNMIKSMM